MALYSSVVPPTPRIIITAPHEEGPSQVPSRVPWKRGYLAAIWITQFFWLLLGLAFVPYEPADWSWPTLLLLLVSLGNLVLVTTPCIEAHKYAVGTLTPLLFLKLQKWKAGWILGGLCVVILSQLTSETRSGLVYTIFIDLLYLMPFGAGYWYARVIMREVIGRGEEPKNASISLA